LDKSLAWLAHKSPSSMDVCLLNNSNKAYVTSH